MDQAFNIIQMIHNQTPIEQIEKEIDWENLTQADYENLFAEVELLGGAKSGFDLLGLMYKAAKDRDYWIETRILAAVITRPEPEIERSKLLKRMGYCLDMIRKSLGKVHKSDPLQLKYRRYLCDYVFLSARQLDDAGDIDNALKEYTAAQKAYTEYNFLDAAKEIDLPISRLQRLKRQGEQLIPFQTFADRRSQIEKDLTSLTAQYHNRSIQLEEINSQINHKESKLLNLNAQLKELTENLAIIRKTNQELKGETTALESRKEASQAWLDQIEKEKTSLVEQVISLREQSQALDVRVSQTALKLNDRLAALQAQIDLKNSELDKIIGVINQKTDAVNELDKIIEQRRQELGLIEDRIHSDEAYLVELVKRRTESELKSYREEPLSEELVFEKAEDKHQEELASKLERYKKSLKANRPRKSTKANQEAKQD